jgi:hypothetical protein
MYLKKFFMQAPLKLMAMSVLMAAEFFALLHWVTMFPMRRLKPTSWRPKSTGMGCFIAMILPGGQLNESKTASF